MDYRLKDNIGSYTCVNRSIHSLGEFTFKKKYITHNKILETLVLSYNKLFSIHNESFKNLVALKRLILNNNKIETLVENIFSTNINLNVLDVRNNLIIDILYDFGQNKQLFKILLDGNPLQGLKRSAFESFMYKKDGRQTVRMFLKLQYFKCDCSQLWLIKYEPGYLMILGDVKCTHNSLPSLRNMKMDCLIYKNCTNHKNLFKKAVTLCEQQERGFISIYIYIY